MNWQPRQQVNFYLPEFHPVSLPRRVKRLLRELGVLVLVILLAIAVGQGYRFFIGQQLRDLQQQNDSLLAAVEVEHKRLLAPPLDAALAEQLQQSKERVEEARLRVGYLQGVDGQLDRQIGSGSGFVALMSELGQLSLSSLWLSEAHITDQGRDVALGGLVQEPVAVSRYLDLLAQLPAYQGRQFEQIDIQQQQHAFRFWLDTRPHGTSAATTTVPDSVRKLQGNAR
ncbi:hypothetical protein [Oceanobacter mangrovi]|uniref:hypothetical protein n=1 Tax=Oceanobacter mangrovi TaxID=2862510 RepID=UPI001C8D597A|nr:hypothetical protein [Oceanobacter mangrovi]